MKAKKKRAKKVGGPNRPYLDSLTDEELQSLDVQRRNIDEVSQLPEGFTIKDNGVFGTIYYRKKSKILETVFEYWDQFSREVLADAKGLQQWVLPMVEPISDSEQERIKANLSKIVSALGGNVQYSQLNRLFKNGSMIGIQDDPKGGATIGVYELTYPLIISSKT